MTRWPRTRRGAWPRFRSRIGPTSRRRQTSAVRSRSKGSPACSTRSRAMRPLRAASPGSTSDPPAHRRSGARAGSHPISSTPAMRSTPPGQKRSGRSGLNRDAFERLGVLVAGLFADVAVSLAHEFLEIPFAAGLGDLALVLLQGIDLPIQGRRDVHVVVAERPERDPDLFDLVRLEPLFEQRTKGSRVA